jgi:hypothetical protein
MTTQTPDVVSRTVILVHKDVHDTDVLAEIQRSPKSIVAQNGVG